MYLRIRKILLFILYSFFIVFNCDAKVFKIGGHHNYPPIIWQENGKVVGVAVDIVKLILKELNLKGNFKFNKKWNRAIPLIAMQKIDIIAALYKTTNREKFINFSNEYIIQDQIKIFVKKGNEFPYYIWNDLLGKKMGSIIGDSKGEKFDIFIRKNLTINLTMTRQETFNNLLSNRIDFMASSYYAILIALKKNNYNDKIVPLSTPIITNNLYIGISKGSPINKFQKQIDEKIKKIKSTSFIMSSIKKNIKRYLKGK